jgi:hypothetical protein
MDETTNTQTNESGVIETNNSDVKTNVSEEVKSNSENVVNEENKSFDIDDIEKAQKDFEELQPEKNKLLQPGKIKLGEEEYTPEEIKSWKEQAEAQKVEQEKNEYQPRELTVIETDLQREVSNFEADAVNIKKNFIAKATPPIVEQVNPETGLTEQYYQYSVEDAFMKGIKGSKPEDWNAFINCLSPQDAIEFKDARDNFAKEYQQKVGKLEQEQKYIQAVEAKKADVAKWDTYIQTNESPAEKHLLNGLKDKYNFDEKGIKDFLTLFRQAKALEQNASELNSDTENAKKMMMNSTVTGGSKLEGGSKIFTDAEIGKMTNEQFKKYEKIIDEQYKKGLIK